MKMILLKSIYHAFSQEYRDVYVSLYQEGDLIRADAYFNEKIIYSYSEKIDDFSAYLDKIVLLKIVKGVAKDKDNWVDATKCRILAQNIRKFKIVSKKSYYIVNNNGLDFELEVNLDANTFQIDLVLKNKYNKDVLELHTSAESELEATDNALIYAEMMSSVAMGFKSGQSILIREHEVSAEN